MKTGIKTIVAGFSLFVIVVLIILLAITLSHVDSTEKQFKVPGKTQVVIEKPGRYYLRNDYQTLFEGKNYDRAQIIPDGIEIRITNAETGKLFGFVSDTSISSTSSGGRDRKSVV